MVVSDGGIHCDCGAPRRSGPTRRHADNMTELRRRRCGADGARMLGTRTQPRGHHGITGDCVHASDTGRHLTCSDTRPVTYPSARHDMTQLTSSISTASPTRASKAMSARQPAGVRGNANARWRQRSCRSAPDSRSVPAECEVVPVPVPRVDVDVDVDVELVLVLAACPEPEAGDSAARAADSISIAAWSAVSSSRRAGSVSSRHPAMCSGANVARKVGSEGRR